MMATHTIKLDFRINDRFTSVRAAMGRINAVEDAARSSESHKFEIDISKCDYLGADGAALIARFILLANSNGHKIIVKKPVSPAALRSYWITSGLDYLINHGNLSDAITNNNQPVIALTQAHQAKFTDANPFIRLIKSHQTMSSELEEYLRICINEVIQNVQDHSQSGIGAVMTARYMSTSKEIRVAIVDSGKGICETLKSKYPDSTPELSFKRVIKGGYSAMSRVNNMGLGISNLCSIVADHLGGKIFIISDQAAVEIESKRQPNIRSLDFCFQGTASFFTFPVTE